jgi:16S rRNA (cytidine1402-2'-O)-methyltransferase
MTLGKDPAARHRRWQVAVRTARTPAVPGTLYVVATPLGNLEDVTLRALRVLREVDLIAAEDTRRTRILLDRHGIGTAVTSYYDAVERARAPRLVAQLVAGKSVALVSDAGTPGIADPGYHVVRAAIAAEVPVVPVPGPSAVAALVSIAGVPAERFCFEGFLPPRVAARARRLAELAREPRAIVLLEAGRRLPALLEAAAAAFGAREAVVGRELTKRYEEVLRGPLPELAARVRAGGAVRGEVTVLLAGRSGEDPAGAVDDTTLEARLLAALRGGTSVRDAATALAHETGRSRRDLYQRALALNRRAKAG